ncbi:MAG TPA: DUF2085 domain-containing protein [Thermoanaerobaculia bacterium]|nr:DUF2085 domain-containing protein [Thermoanaerobaculia bacterium]
MTANARIANVVFLAMPLLILKAAVLCTLAVAHGASPRWRLPFRLLCHGIADRCLTIEGTPMPICARCTGIYVGMLAALIAFALIAPLQRMVMPNVVAVLLIVPLALDAVSQAVGVRSSTNPVRLITGLMAGCSVLWAMSRVDRRIGVGPHGVRPVALEDTAGDQPTANQGGEGRNSVHD